jgi:inner membrane protein
MNDERPTRSRIDWNTPLPRIILIGLLILLLQIPILKISGLTYERSMHRDAAAADIASKWGKDQTLTGPYLALSYRCKWVETSPNGKTVKREELVSTNVLPDSLSIDGNVRNDVRRRGIFEVPVYQAGLQLKGQFRRAAHDGCPTKPAQTVLERASLVVRISDPRAITGPLALQWNQDSLRFLPGTGDSTGLESAGIHADVKQYLKEDLFNFQIPMTFNGSNTLNFAPFAERTDVTLRSDWPHPSFQGNWLPREHNISDTGFTAAWTVSHLGRDYPQQMPSLETYKQQINASQFGIHFKAPVDSYSVTGRIVKYDLLILGLVFATLWLFELMSQLRVHPLQYLLVGSGMCLFYLLQLSLAEHLGLLLAYLIASGSVTGLVTTYCLSVLKSGKRASVIGGVLALLYGYLYVLLQLEDYALLAGSIGLFVTLAIVMYVTRRIDWYRAYKEETADTSDTAAKTR